VEEQFSLIWPMQFVSATTGLRPRCDAAGAGAAGSGMPGRES